MEMIYSKNLKYWENDVMLVFVSHSSENTFIDFNSFEKFWEVSLSMQNLISIVCVLVMFRCVVWNMFRYFYGWKVLD